MSDDIKIEVPDRMGIEIPGLYDGVAVWVYDDGTIINRFAQDNAFASEHEEDPLLWSDRYVKAADDWIRQFGQTFTD